MKDTIYRGYLKCTHINLMMNLKDLEFYCQFSFRNEGNFLKFQIS